MERKEIDKKKEERESKKREKGYVGRNKREKRKRNILFLILRIYKKAAYE